MEAVKALIDIMLEQDRAQKELAGAEDGLNRARHLPVSLADHYDEVKKKEEKLLGVRGKLLNLRAKLES